MLAAFRRMRDLPPEERDGFLNGGEIERRFSPDERRLLSRLAHLLPEGGEGLPPPEAGDALESDPLMEGTD
jgi:hypothetical protein